MRCAFPVATNQKLPMNTPNQKISRGGAESWSVKKCAFHFITYFVVCFCGLAGLYGLVSLLMNESAFGWLPRMFLYHEQHPMQYIGVVAICYAAVASLWTACMKRKRLGVRRILEALAVILVALVLACPLGGMLWHFHDMQAGFFPHFWLRKLLRGFVDGLMVGPMLVFFSFPYNIIGLIAGCIVTIRLNSFFRN